MSVLSNSCGELTPAHLIAGAFDASSVSNIKDILKNLRSAIGSMPGVHKVGPGESVNIKRSYVVITKPDGLFVDLMFQGPVSNKGLWANYEHITLNKKGDGYTLEIQHNYKGINNRQTTREHNDIYRIPNTLYNDLRNAVE